jgi:hypothetical protein
MPPQGNAGAAAAIYDQAAGGSLQSSSTDAGDAVMARWLQSAGLQHLGSPHASSGIDHRLLPNLLMQVSLLLLQRYLDFLFWSDLKFVALAYLVMYVYGYLYAL